MILLEDQLKFHIQHEEIAFVQKAPDGEMRTDWSKIGPNSLDVTISPLIRRRKVTSGRPLPYLPWRGPDESTYWGPHEFLPQITLKPHETILAVTNEIVGSRKRFVPIFVQRSGLGRIGQGFMAGFGDVGYIAPWTLEFTNHLEVEVIIPAGVKVGQIYFMRGDGMGKLYAGSYGKEMFDPEDMLPKLHRDKKRTIYGWLEEENELENQTKIKQNQTHVQTSQDVPERLPANTPTDAVQTAEVESNPEQYDEDDMSGDAIQSRIAAMRKPWDGKDGHDRFLDANNLLDFERAVQFVMGYRGASAAAVESALTNAIFNNTIGTTLRPDKIAHQQEYDFSLYRNLFWRATQPQVQAWAKAAAIRPWAGDSESEPVVYESIGDWARAVDATVQEQPWHRPIGTPRDN